MNKFQIIEITWLDSLHTSGWTKEDAAEMSPLNQMKQQSIGYFLRENKRAILIVQSKRDDGYYVDAIMEIPKVSISKIKRLK